MANHNLISLDLARDNLNVLPEKRKLFININFLKELIASKLSALLHKIALYPKKNLLYLNGISLILVYKLMGVLKKLSSLVELNLCALMGIVQCYLTN